LKKRLVEREATMTTSDARLHHLKRFRTRFEPLTDLRDELHIRVDTNMAHNESIRQILSIFPDGERQMPSLRIFKVEILGRKNCGNVEKVM
jgi:hypothetical protein